MAVSPDESAATLAKSQGLIRKALSRLSQLDASGFPTGTTGDCVRLLREALERLNLSSNLVACDSAVLYNRLFAISELVDLLEQSSNNRISWPLVRYCDELWRLLFGHSGPKIFYSLTPEHNYSIFEFTTRLNDLLVDLLTDAQRKALFSGPEIYCLQLAATEDYNLPLYSIIGHEFGHTVCWERETEIVAALDQHFKSFLADLRSQFQSPAPILMTTKAIFDISIELICDMVGCLLMGPAFMLSLYEITWGQIGDQWNVAINECAYPSDFFRLHLAKQWSKCGDFAADAAREFQRLKDHQLKSLPSLLLAVPDDHAADTVAVVRGSHPEAADVQAFIQAKLQDIKSTLVAFLTDMDGKLRQWYPSIGGLLASTRDVSELVLRLENHVLPNVIPDGTLLGQPASMAAILNAAGLYRFHLLRSSTTGGADAIEEIETVERLVAKALEVSFVQREFQAWNKSRVST